jgi:hypothetical protein
MFKKKTLLLIVFSIFTFFFILLPSNDVYAIDPICTGKKFNAIRQEASTIKLKYDLTFDQNHNAYFIVTFTDVSHNLYLKLNEENMVTPDENGVIQLSYMFDGGKKYSFEFYVSQDTICADTFVTSRDVTMPKYNYFSERDECLEYEEFPLCNTWYKGTIRNEEQFLIELDAYKSTLQKNGSSAKPNRNIFERAVDFYTDNLSITGPITAIVIIAVAIIVVRKLILRKQRVRIKIDE